MRCLVRWLALQFSASPTRGTAGRYVVAGDRGVVLMRGNSGKGNEVKGRPGAGNEGRAVSGNRRREEEGTKDVVSAPVAA
jgi:hypothetical protein